MAFNVSFENLPQEIIQECKTFFQKALLSELESLKEFNLKEKYEFYLNKIRSIENFFENKKFPLKDDYNLIFFDLFQDKFIIGWEKNVDKCRVLLILLYKIIKIGLNRSLFKITKKFIETDETVSNKEIEELINKFSEIFSIDIKVLELKGSKLDGDLKEELNNYQNHVKHYFDF